MQKDVGQLLDKSKRAWYDLLNWYLPLRKVCGIPATDSFCVLALLTVLFIIF